MAAKLRSISGKIPWSLARRAALFALAWLALPFWVFLIVALWLYFVPLFDPLRLAVPFVVTLVFAGVLDPNVPTAIFVGALFFLILGIKDLVLVNRRSAYETLVLFILFGLFLKFFARFPNAGNPWIFAATFGIALVFYLLVRRALDYETLPAPPGPPPQAGRRAHLAVGLAAFLLFEFTALVLLLPLNVFYQTALAFLSAIALRELTLDYVAGRAKRKSVLTTASVFLTFLVLILASNTWGL